MEPLGRAKPSSAERIVFSVLIRENLLRRHGDTENIKHRENRGGDDKGDRENELQLKFWNFQRVSTGATSVRA